ncbi:peptidoglycan-binding domain-containing protein [Alisedimentitalea sp. MJ-SS2]|uniref:peptidoglycan-binding domain-containing protein n=1 Tax=Aliisedimentitalea sp. MJ-SS2 TaxID=3049795 RepID=UPI002910CEEE|nr:peptidoglycan-binding domain-containing protein [Alisedimentitalea sp. MJ-SS2]MDU8927514.1 peptidoglycan-binding domain-containing protein [Alisedimentitalea sp. MJ-SS2]
MSIRTLLPICGAFAALAACTPPHLGGPIAALGSEPALVQTYQAAPPGAPDGSCWGKDVSPAMLETVTDRVLIQPAQVLDDGTVMSEPVYRLETRQAIVRERRELWFQTPCEDQLTPDFISSLQRALQARSLYRGAITGEMDARTRRAIRRFQQPQGLDSSILSLSAARQLGLAAVARDEG